MRILQTVTYISETAAFGGPTSVAIAQARALARLGHEVTLLAGWDGRLALDLPGVKVVLVKVASPHSVGGFSLLWSPRLRAALTSASRDADLVHVHFGRHLIDHAAASAAIRVGKPLILQTHGMVAPRRSLRARVWDRLSTKRALRVAFRVLVLTDEEHAQLLELGVAPTALETIPNGVDMVPPTADAVGGSRDREVLFLARLQRRKNPQVFVEMARALLNHGVDAIFSIAGPDEGELDAVAARVAESGWRDRIRIEEAVPPSEVLRRLARASVFVLPSSGEVLPMSVLEAASVATPMVLSEDCGLAPTFAMHEAAIVVPPTAERLAAAVLRLMDDPRGAAAMGARAQSLVAARYSATAVAETLGACYQSALTAHDVARARNA